MLQITKTIETWGTNTVAMHNALHFLSSVLKKIYFQLQVRLLFIMLLYIKSNLSQVEWMPVVLVLITLSFKLISKLNNYWVVKAWLEHHQQQQFFKMTLVLIWFNYPKLKKMPWSTVILLMQYYEVYSEIQNFNMSKKCYKWLKVVFKITNVKMI